VRRVRHLLHDPPRVEPEVIDIDLRRLHTERRERCANLTAMVGAVVQGLREPEPDGSPPLIPVGLVDLEHHRVGVERPGDVLSPSGTVALHDDASLGERHMFFVDVGCDVAGQEEQLFRVAEDNVAKASRASAPACRGRWSPALRR
jgi:hypothetical protein